jgi:hypothetical protein
MVHTLLRVTYAVPTRRHTSLGMEEGEQAQLDHLQPALACVLNGSAACLRAIRNLFSEEAFFQMCFTMKGASQCPMRRFCFFRYICSLSENVLVLPMQTTDCAMGRSLFQSLLLTVRRRTEEFHVTRGPGNARATDFRAFSDCLKILLEVVSATGVKLPPLHMMDLRDEALRRRRRDDKLRVALRAQIEHVQQEMRAVSDRSATHRAFFLYPTARRDREVLETSEAMKDVSARWGNFQRSKETITAQLHRTHFQANIRCERSK